MKTHCILALALLALAACDKAPSPPALTSDMVQAEKVVRPPAYDPEVLSYAVLDVLKKALQIDTNTDKPLSQAEGACDLKEIAEKREWVRVTIQDSQLRVAYLDWLTYFDGQVHQRMNPAIVEEKAKTSVAITEGSLLADTLPQPPPSKEHCVP